MELCFRSRLTSIKACGARRVDTSSVGRASTTARRRKERTMRPTDILSAEHRVIEQVLDCLQRIGENAASSGTLDMDSARAALRVLRTFADRCHHGKEEERLFPMLAKRGLPTHVGP